MSDTFDPKYTRRCFEANLRPLATGYFEARAVDIDNLPLDELGRRAIILVSNHAGMGLSWDNIILDFPIYDRLVHTLGDADAAVRHKAVRLIDPLLIRRSAVRPRR